MNRTRYWWPKASTEDRLHQVKHAIEARLTQGETATLLGAPCSQDIGKFARYHGLSFANSDQSFARKRQLKNNDSLAAARISSLRYYGHENTEIFDRLDNRREIDDGEAHELRFG
jgi:hypothetical protein